MTTIILARHGETDWNLEQRVQGHTDRPLTEKGREQAVQLARALAGEALDAVYSSDLERARETARMVAEPRGLPVTPLPELREKHFGTWEGLAYTEVLLRFPEAHRGSWGDGETSEEVAGRVLAALRAIAEEQRGGRVLVVTHGGPLRVVLRHCTVPHDGPIDNCHVLRLAVENGSIRAVD